MIAAIRANEDWTLDVSFNDGAERRYDVKPLLDCEAFAALRNVALFKAIRNGGYFVEWDNEADLSADTLYLEGTVIKGDLAGGDRSVA
jgi:hypothetical protein